MNRLIFDDVSLVFDSQVNEQRNQEWQPQEKNLNYQTYKYQYKKNNVPESNKRTAPQTGKKPLNVESGS